MMNTQETSTTTSTSDAWRDIWTDPETARINARRDAIQHDADDMAEFYAQCRAAVS